MINRIKDYTLLLALIFIPLAIGVGTTYVMMKNFYDNAPVGDFNDRIAEISRDNAYEFLPKEMSDYILKMCEELGVDPDLVVAILLNENPMLDNNHINRNNNGSIDIGLFQLNDRYLYSTFQKRYWKFKDVELNPTNWKHNTYIAIHHIRYLSKTHKLWDEIVMAYNCGSTAVMKNRVPESTKEYLARAQKNYALLKNRVNIDLEPSEIIIEADDSTKLADRR